VATGVAAAATKWYLAEGYTGPGFETWLLIANPGDSEAAVQVSYMKENGEVIRRDYQVAARSRFSIGVNQVEGVAGTGVSMLVESLNGAAVVAERSIYFNAEGRVGGTCAQGVTGPAAEWHFAEGYTGPGFDTWILVQNPDDRDAAIAVDLLPEDGSAPRTVRFPVKAHSRFTMHVNDFFPDQGLSARVYSENGVPVVAERSVYFDYFGIRGGHGSSGVTAPSETWYFAEGYTAAAFDTWLLFENPGAAAAVVQVDFALEDGTNIRKELTVEPHSRYTLFTDTVPGLEATSFAMRVTSDRPIVSERSMYFQYQGRDDGSNAPGSTQPSTHWYFAEGYTGG
jgi:hypothetical protein